MSTLAEMPRPGVSRPVRLSMARMGKWIEGAGASERVAVVARQAIEARLEVVWARLTAAAAQLSDVENVHQLRVASRRAVAALDIFERLLPPRRGKWMKRQLKRIRRTAGEARDLDVLSARLVRRALKPDEAFCLPVIDRIQIARRAAQGPIERIARRLMQKDFPSLQDSLVRRVRARDDADADVTFGQYARTVMRRLADEFFAAGGTDLTNINQLHAFRIEAKRLRYAMEVFAGAFDEDFRRELYPQVEAIQEQLGEVNDYAAAAARLSGWLAEAGGGAAGEALSRLIAEEESELAAGQARFIDGWSQSRSEQLRSAFDAQLTPGAAVR